MNKPEWHELVFDKPISVRPGEVAEVLVTFDEDGKPISCVNVPGGDDSEVM